MKHTPGPWKARHSGFGDAEVVGSEITGIPAPFTPTVIGSRLNWADANLIAAAPELLEALERVVDLLGPDPIKEVTIEPITVGLMKDIGAAIAKAKGE